VVVSIDYNEDSGPSTVVVPEHTPERSAPAKLGRQLAHTVSMKQEETQVTAAPPRRLAKGTSPVAPRSASASPFRADADDPTRTSISIADPTAIISFEDRTKPALPLQDPKKSGAPLPTIRGRLAR
jgi:hypothetical protein